MTLSGCAIKTICFGKESAVNRDRHFMKLLALTVKAMGFAIRNYHTTLLIRFPSPLIRAPWLLIRSPWLQIRSSLTANTLLPGR